MAITYASSVLVNRMQQVVNAIDSGAGSGRIQLGTTGMGLVLSTVVLLKPCATISTGGLMTFSGTPLVDPAAAASGVAAAGRIINSAGSVVASGLTVGLAGSGANIIIKLVNVTAGSIVTFQSGSI